MYELFFGRSLSKICLSFVSLELSCIPLYLDLARIRESLRKMKMCFEDIVHRSHHAFDDWGRRIKYSPLDTKSRIILEEEVLIKMYDGIMRLEISLLIETMHESMDISCEKYLYELVYDKFKSFFIRLAGYMVKKSS